AIRKAVPTAESRVRKQVVECDSHAVCSECAEEDQMKTNTSQQATILLALVSICSLLEACGGGPRDPESQQQPTTHVASLTVLSGDNQSAMVGTPLAAPLVIEVKDQSGQPFPGATVSWNVTVGGASVHVTSNVTSPDGTSSMQWTLGTTAGPNKVTGTVVGA